MPLACNPAVQCHATLRVSVLAGLITLGLIAAPPLPHPANEKASGASVLISAPEIVLTKRTDRVPSLEEVTFSAPARRQGLVAALPASTDSEGGLSQAKVTPLDRAEIVDAATLKTSVMTVRLAGIEAPKPNQTCRRLDGLLVSCLDRAQSYLQLLIKGRSVACDRSGTASDGLDEGRCRFGDTDIAEQLVRQGWAKAGPLPEERIVTAEHQAKRQKLGIWQ